MTDTEVFYKQFANAINGIIGPDVSSEPAGRVLDNSSDPSASSTSEPMDSANKAAPQNSSSNKPTENRAKPTRHSGDWTKITDGEMARYVRNLSSGLSGTNQNVHDFLRIVTYVLKTKYSGQVVYITSGHRSPEEQTDTIMKNWDTNGGGTKLPKPVTVKGVTVSTFGEADTVKVYGPRFGQEFHKSMMTMDRAEVRKKYIEYYTANLKAQSDKGVANHLTGGALDFRIRGAPHLLPMLNECMKYADIKIGNEGGRKNPHIHVQINGIKSTGSSEAKVSNLFPLTYKSALQISVEPYNSVINEELTNMASKLGSDYFSYTNTEGKKVQITKIVLEDGDPGHFGMVRSNDPSTIYLSFNKIRNAGAGAANDEALRASIREVLSHEMGHFKDNLKGGEGPAEAESHRVTNMFGTQASFGKRAAAEFDSIGLHKEAALIRKSLGIKVSYLDQHLKPEDVSQSILRIIYHFVQKVKPENQSKYVRSLARKIQQMDLPSLAQRKKNPGGGVGQTMALVKNILAGLEPETIGETIRLTFEGLAKLAQ